MTYFVYVYNTDEGVPYYVGKGCKARHLNRRRHTVELPSKENIQVFECDTENEAIEIEIFLIEFFGRKLDDGILENLSLGGPGCRGYKGGVRNKRKVPPSPSILERPMFAVN